jgi:very-short-patch-repair endonuclease
LGQLRLWQLDGNKFRRQQRWDVISWILFVWKNELLFEVDGGQHAQQATLDAKRDRWLRDEGFVVLRFWNHDVLKNIDVVKEQVYKTLQSTPYLNPSPPRGRRARAKRNAQTPF